jgi:leucyl-tRNA synthetase
MMIFVNALDEEVSISKSTYTTFIQLLAPFAPHMTEELWSEFGNTTSVHLSTWPKHDETKMVDSEVVIVLQVSGKVRDTFASLPESSDEEVHILAKRTVGYQKYVGEIKPKKIIVIKNKLINVVL